MGWRRKSQNTFVMWTVLYWTRSWRTQFGLSINVWRLAGDNLNITCNFLYCNHQVHRDFLITLCIKTGILEIILGLITVKPQYNVTAFVAHTTLWTETISFPLSRFTTTNCSEQTENIFNPHFIKCVGGDFVHDVLRNFNCDSGTVKFVLENIGVVQQDEPRSIICKL